MGLFGTDGIRGVAFEHPLDQETVKRIGLALARNLEVSGPPRLLLGRDTRQSGAAIERWLTAGLEAGGAEVHSARVIPTPAVAFLTQELGLDAGIVISASHNPYRDNGIKILLASGEKSNEALEAAIEAEVERKLAVPEVEDEGREPRALESDLEALYLDHLEATCGSASPPDGGFSVLLDCANGAGYRVGPMLLDRLGIAHRAIAVEPNGENINRECGSTHLDGLRSLVREGGYSLGAALDGDGDRLLLCDSTGRVVDGDAILLLSARRLKKEGRLTGDGVVATVMSNMALEKALSEEGVRLYRTQVGDKYVRREMAGRNIILGGEQSGHILFTELANTGDGLLTLVQVLRTLWLENETLDELGRLEPFPQVLQNVPVRERPDLEDVPEIAAAVAKAERQLDGRGRVLLRYSGTEPFLRIMIEGPTRDEIEALARDISRQVERSIGGEA